jgi:hypothetical protein
MYSPEESNEFPFRRAVQADENLIVGSGPNSLLVTEL